MGNVLIFVEAQPRWLARKATLNAITAGQKLAQGHRRSSARRRRSPRTPPVCAGEVKDYVKAVHAGSAAHLEHPIAENLAPALAALAKSLGVEYVCAAATSVGRDLMPRVAAKLKAAMASEVLSVEGAGADLTFGAPDVGRRRHRHREALDRR